VLLLLKYLMLKKVVVVLKARLVVLFCSCREDWVNRCRVCFPFGLIVVVTVINAALSAQSEPVDLL
jgi:hypothetical protein